MNSFIFLISFISSSKVDKRSFKDLFSSFKDLFSSFKNLLSSRVERSAHNSSAFEEVPPFKSFAFTPPPNPNTWLRVCGPQHFSTISILDRDGSS